jgi:hypothetical protein
MNIVMSLLLNSKGWQVKAYTEIMAAMEMKKIFFLKSSL